MSTAIARRVDRVESDRFTKAVRHFRPWFIEHLRESGADRHRAALIAAGAPADGTWADIHAWLETQPTSPACAAICAAVDALMERPDDHAAIRAALARVAPHVGRCAGDPPLTVLAALRAGFAGARAPDLAQHARPGAAPLTLATSATHAPTSPPVVRGRECRARRLPALLRQPARPARRSTGRAPRPQSMRRGVRPRRRDYPRASASLPTARWTTSPATSARRGYDKREGLSPSLAKWTWLDIARRTRGVSLDRG
jgi:hypothetical protein